ncbi:MAG: MBL fold metallo-hydrolase, partial [Planctomycetota bacterium]
GSVCFYLKGLLFSGDTLFEESIGRTWGSTEEEKKKKTQQLIEGIRKKLLVLPGDTKVFPGHGPSTTIKHEKEHNPFLQ